MYSPESCLPVETGSEERQKPEPRLLPIPYLLGTGDFRVDGSRISLQEADYPRYVVDPKILTPRKTRVRRHERRLNRRNARYILDQPQLALGCAVVRGRVCRDEPLLDPVASA